jgi:hypothetical protein
LVLRELKREIVPFRELPDEAGCRRSGLPLSPKLLKLQMQIILVVRIVTEGRGTSWAEGRAIGVL